MSGLKRPAKVAAAAVIIFIVTLAAYLVMDKKSGKEQGKPAGEAELSAWIVDWQWESGIEDLETLAESLSSLQVFAAYFDHTDSLYLREDFHHMLPQIVKTYNQKGGGDLYLTLVNDRFEEDGSSVQKDTDLITRLMTSEDSRAKHLNEIMVLVDRYGFDGVEIDYEKIGEDDWSSMVAFYGELYQRLREKGKLLRVVLESRAPIERLSLPEGPVYVMMAYNLYGSHGEPGPKADHAFITELAKRLEKIPGEKVIALSAGGFDWPEEGKVTSLTEKQASELAQRSSEKPKRDEASGSLYYRYWDEEQLEHTVWYADEITLAGWMDTARQAGYNKIALWRLGDMGPAALEYLSTR
ncbi:glycosyl hydrolase family 18 protein [Paenibacillus mendelii]|uniref:Glycosyl hydrolase family 18 protein n=1 Tax=Paenibacillus mendelii TaxID=206163 RepID=A0ABV6JKJ3_9BACL|nr:glycosyl hydrolase family 18 protein [Paenibacillus mendelii]MCQ6563038.1 glycosyl hydrolase family 18 protein [Paenibacillus mendelii]